MAATLIFKDETLSGNLIQEMSLPIEAETLTLREIIMLRVEEEIRRMQDEQTRHFLVALSDLSEQERLLNGNKWTGPNAKNSTQPAGPDPEAQGYRALEAFKRNAYFVLVDNKQVDELETSIRLTDETVVSFVKITPLVGG